MEKKNSVFIAQSLDGYIADRNGGLEWLEAIPNPDHLDMGYVDFIHGMDAIVMGRKTFETVCSFDCDWPYQLPVFVLSNTLKAIPDSHTDKAILVKGDLKEVVANIHQQGYYRLYIDGGKCLQSFLKEDLIDEIILTTIPVLLGGGTSLFGHLPSSVSFDLVSSKIYLNQIIQSHYRRQKTIH